MSIFLPLILAILAPTSALTAPAAGATVLDPAASETCLAWMKERTGEVEPETRVVASDTLCADLSGPMGFTPDSTEQFLQLLAALPGTTPPHIIVRSPGGMVELGMKMGEAITARRVAPSCMSLQPALPPVRTTSSWGRQSATS